MPQTLILPGLDGAPVRPLCGVFATLSVSDNIAPKATA